MDGPQKMSDVETLDAAAQALREGCPLNDGHRELLADILRAEAIIRAEMEPFVDLLNVVVKLGGGDAAFIRLAKHEETGEIKLLGDNTNNSVRLARAIIHTTKEN